MAELFGLYTSGALIPFCGPGSIFAPAAENLVCTIKVGLYSIPAIEPVSIVYSLTSLILFWVWAWPNQGTFAANIGSIQNFFNLHCTALDDSINATICSGLPKKLSPSLKPDKERISIGE